MTLSSFWELHFKIGPIGFPCLSSSVHLNGMKYRLTRSSVHLHTHSCSANFWWTWPGEVNKAPDWWSGPIQSGPSSSSSPAFHYSASSRNWSSQVFPIEIRTYSINCTIIGRIQNVCFTNFNAPCPSQPAITISMPKMHVNTLGTTTCHQQLRESGRSRTSRRSTEREKDNTIDDKNRADRTACEDRTYRHWGWEFRGAKMGSPGTLTSNAVTGEDW